MQPVALMRLDGNAVVVVITDEALGSLTEAVYVWTTQAGEWLRVGTSKAPIKKRLLSYATDISRSLTGVKSATPEWEAAQWKAILTAEGPLIALAHQPSLVETIAGKIRPYLDIERALITQRKPRLNRSHR